MQINLDANSQAMKLAMEVETPGKKWMLAISNGCNMAFLAVAGIMYISKIMNVNDI